MGRVKFVISLTDTRLAAARCGRRGKLWTALRVESLVLPAGSDNAAITLAIRDFLEKLKFRSEPIVVLLPRKAVILRQLKVPAVDPAEISGMIGFWAPRYVPYPAEELVTAYSLIKRDKGYSQIVINISQKKDIDRFMEIFRPWQQYLQAIVLDSYALVGAAQIYAKKQPCPAVIVETANDSRDIVVACGDKLLFTRTVPVGSDVEFAVEVEKTIQAYLKENIGPKPEQIVVSGGGGLVKLLQERSQLPVSAVDLGDLSLAAVLNSDLGTVDLMPPAVRVACHDRQTKKELAGIFTLMIVTLAAAGLALGAAYYEKRSYLDRLNAEFVNTPEFVRQVYAVQQRISSAQKRLSRVKAIDVISEIYRILPAGLYLTNLSYESGKEVVLRGRSPDLSGVFDSLGLFDKSTVFKGAKVNFATKRKGRGGEVVEFEIVAYMQDNTDAKKAK